MYEYHRNDVYANDVSIIIVQILYQQSNIDYLDIHGINQIDLIFES